MAVDGEHEAVVRLLLGKGTDFHTMEEARSKGYSKIERLLKSGTIQGDQDQDNPPANVWHGPWMVIAQQQKLLGQVSKLVSELEEKNESAMEQEMSNSLENVQQVLQKFKESESL